MSTSPSEFSGVEARDVAIDDDAITVVLRDGRTVIVPLTWFPRLLHASASERANWRWVGQGSGIRWPEIDEDISVEALLAGRRSAESQASLGRWLAARGMATT